MERIITVHDGTGHIECMSLEKLPTHLTEGCALLHSTGVLLTPILLFV